MISTRLLSQALVLGALCAGLPSRILAAEIFKVGVIQSLSGIAAEDGKTVVQALELAADAINRPNQPGVKLIIEDDQTDPKKAVAAYQKLRSQNVDAVIAASWDFTTNSLLPLAERDKLVLFNTSTLPESLDMKKAAGYVFINAISVRQESAPFNAFIKLRKPSSLGIIYANNSWGETQLAAYEQIARTNEVNLVEKISSQNFDENEWRQIMPRLKAKNPAALLLLLNRNDLDVFLRRAREIGLRSLLFASKNAFDAFRLSKAPEIFEGLCFTYPLEQVKENKQFATEYQKRFGEKPRIYADNTYDALWILHKAFLSSQAGKIPLNQALRQVRHAGLAGEYDFSYDRSFAAGRSSLVCIAHAALSVLG